MDSNQHRRKPTLVVAGMQEMHLQNESPSSEPAGRIQADEIKEEETHSPKTIRTKSSTHSPVSSERRSTSSDMVTKDNEKIVGGDVVVKMEPGLPPKLARTASRKVVARPAPLFDSYEDKTEECKTSFQVIPACIYMSKHIGSTEHAMECDCTEEWGKTISSFAQMNDLDIMLKVPLR